MLINVYCTHREPPTLDFEHTLKSRRDRQDPELAKHLHGMLGYIHDKTDGQLSQKLYHLMRHVQRVQHQIALDVPENALDDLAVWAHRANAVLLTSDGAIRDPGGRAIVHPTGEVDDESGIPFPASALERRDRTHGFLDSRNVDVMKQLPPVLGEEELHLRDAQEVATRAQALLVVALRAESLATESALPLDEIRKRLPRAFEALSPQEREFLDNAKPERETIIQMAWRYEALYLLLWALGYVDDLTYPSGICEPSSVVRLMLDQDPESFIDQATLRPANEILDIMDLHYRLHWVARQARLEQKDSPDKLEEGVIQERRKALNWLSHFEYADWDAVDTPT